jgi:endoglucanase
MRQLAFILVLLLTPQAPQAELFIRVNQAGYLPADSKIAVIFTAGTLPEQFEVVGRDGGRVLQGSLARRPGTWGEFGHFAEADFSSLRTPGQYTIRVAGAESHVVHIGPSVFTDAADAMLGFMRAQRCGYNPFLDTVCHRFDGRTAEGPRPAGSFLPAHGGWHDAGDTLKYLITSSNATAQLILAYRLAPSAWKDRVNALGQDGANGRPDILDEARCGLEWMLRLHPAPGELYHMVADDRDHSGWRLPQDDGSDYGWGKGSYRPVYFATGKPQGLGKFKSESTGIANIAGRYTAAMALAYETFKGSPYDADFARACLRAAREIYAMGKRQEGFQQGNSYGAPYRYNERSWADDMEWGAAELYRATGERQYLVDARRYAQEIGSTSWMGLDTAGHYEYYPFMNLGHYRLHGAGVESSLRVRLSAFYREGIDATREKAARNPWNLGVPFIWCSNNLAVALATQGALYERMTGTTRLRAYITRQRDWLFGVNPWGVSMFTGIGAEAATDVHIPWMQLTKRALPGGLVDGPVKEEIFLSLKGVALSRPDRFARFQSREAVYHDDWQDYSTNEPTMDGTASAILLMALQAVR